MLTYPALLLPLLLPDAHQLLPPDPAAARRRARPAGPLAFLVAVTPSATHTASTNPMKMKASAMPPHHPLCSP
ncbi:hypothetical protein [Streptomyces silvensis]|uniref:Uncharacterized protein n=1 Tax=Streptomyces silvensis TaxID=1765722 RepID=A0A0W7WS36_9ACTN|nr:hypothetical protein [Streptomyces silvensis]KUF13361.1 hypothetical protein AT728_33480 [Streptomyces silvensis]